MTHFEVFLKSIDLLISQDQTALLVLSMIYFNECLHAFYQGLFKHSEADFRSREETQHIQLDQFALHE